jgi:hypothetical protein
MPTAYLKRLLSHQGAAWFALLSFVSTIATFVPQFQAPGVLRILAMAGLVLAFLWANLCVYRDLTGELLAVQHDTIEVRRQLSSLAAAQEQRISNLHKQLGDQLDEARHETLLLQRQLDERQSGELQSPC